MLRECHRVLRRNGRIAGYVIYAPSGLSPDQERQASALGPTEVNAPAEPPELASQSGFHVTAKTDVTEGFRLTCEALLRARDRLQARLRAEEGDELFEEERQDKADMLAAIEQGLLRRALVVAVKK